MLVQNKTGVISPGLSSGVGHSRCYQVFFGKEMDRFRVIEFRRESCLIEVDDDDSKLLNVMESCRVVDGDECHNG